MSVKVPQHFRLQHKFSLLEDIVVSTLQKTPVNYLSLELGKIQLELIPP